MHLYAGKILWVDLTEKKIKETSIDHTIVDKYIGGAGYAIRLAIDMIPPGIDPFSAKNPLIIFTGALVGTPFPSATKTIALTKLPIIAGKKDGKYKHFIAVSVVGGNLGLELKLAGYDGLVITGASEEPVYLKIIDNDIEIHDASDLWGKKNIYETTDELRRRHNKCASVVAIGKAGEHLVRYAMAIVDKRDSLGRNGVGAIFGSKKLKAIVVKGSRKGITVADPDRFMKKVLEVRRRIMEWSYRPHWIKLGMGAGWRTFKHTQYPGIWPKDKWDRLCGEEKRLETLERTYACPTCLIACRIKWRIKTGDYAGWWGLGSPYGKSATSAMLWGIEDYNKMIYLVCLANREGLDYYTFTRLVDFFTKKVVEGAIPKDKLGEEIRRDWNCYLRLFYEVIERKGVGNDLAEGWLGVAEKYGLDPQEYWYAGINKGVDFIYDARPARLHPLMFTFVVNPRPHHGGCHTKTAQVLRPLKEIREQFEHWGIPKDRLEQIFQFTPYSGAFNVGRYTKYMEDGMMVHNSLGTCSMYTFFGFFGIDDLAEAYSAATGKEISAEELLRCGERAFNLYRLLNAREGFTREDDKVPKTWLRPMNTPEGIIELRDYYGIIQLTTDDLHRIQDDYYDERGWDLETGLPKKETLIKLGIDIESLPEDIRNLLR
ncbi:MAG: hypothetical protein DRJ40_00825 [Thermoprotei archaeon]|nr:MAG: hypothetical protein DRJ40_00825 [Thermoprotei archaeon]